jgi:galactose mutarotase-like enzyme
LLTLTIQVETCLARERIMREIGRQATSPSVGHHWAGRHGGDSRRRFPGSQGQDYTFETQHFPDSPNQSQFPSTEQKAGQTQNTTTIFAFAS